MTTSLLASVKRKNERRSLFKVGLSPFRPFKRRGRSMSSSSSEQKRARVFGTLKHTGAINSNVASNEDNSSSPGAALDLGTGETVERVVVDDFTMRAMRIEVLDLLGTNRSCSVCALAVALAESGSVIIHFANSNDETKGTVEDEDAMLQSFTTLSLKDAVTTPLGHRQALRRRQLQKALHALEVRVGSSSQQIASWKEAKEVLSEVVQFPDDDVKPKPQTDQDSEVEKYFKRIQEATRAQLHRQQKPPAIKWLQVAKTSLPYSSQDRLSSDYASISGTEAVEPDLVDDAQGRRRQTAIDKVDISLEQRVAKAYEDREKLFRGEALEEAEEHYLGEEREAEAMERASSLLRTLTDEEQEIVQDAMYGGGPEDEIVSQVGTDTVQRVSMHRLQPGQWLNDEVIHYFYIMLAKRDEEMCRIDPHRKRSHFFKSFFMTKLLDEGNADPALAGQYNYNLVKRWSKKAPGKDLFALDRIFFPINVGGVHWICAVAHMTKRKIQIYDSMGSEGMMYLQSIFQYLQDEHKAKKGSPLPDAGEWELVGTTSETPRQRNGFDCGVFTCMFADFLSKDCPLTFSQEHITQCRERIALSIMNGSAIM